MGTMETDLVFGDFNRFPDVQEICDLTSKNLPHLNLDFEYLFRRTAGVRKPLRREGCSDREEGFSELLLQRGYRVGFSRSCLHSKSGLFRCASMSLRDVMHELDHKPGCTRLHRSIQFRVTILDRIEMSEGLVRDIPRGLRLLTPCSSTRQWYTFSFVSSGPKAISAAKDLGVIVTPFHYWILVSYYSNNNIELQHNVTYLVCGDAK